MVWLENFLMRYRETLIIISHDRDILNKTVDHILHLENQKLVSIPAITTSSNAAAPKSC